MSVLQSASLIVRQIHAFEIACLPWGFHFRLVWPVLRKGCVGMCVCACARLRVLVCTCCAREEKRGREGEEGRNMVTGLIEALTRLWIDPFED